MLIGELAQESGFSRDTIRYYEKLGLIQVGAIGRHSNNYKNYPLSTLECLIQISHLKTLGFTLTEIASLLSSFDEKDNPCADLPKQLADKISVFDNKIALLESYKRKLLVIQAACNGKCNSEVNLPDCFSSDEGLLKN